MRTIITNALLIDGTGAMPRPEAVIVVDDGRISRIGRKEDFGNVMPPADEVIDARGKAVVPGLINGHEHITWRRSKGTFTERVGRADAEVLLTKGVGNCLISLVEGVTTIRDVGAKGKTSLALKKATTDGLIVGPRVFACGQVITMMGGHAHVGGLQADGADNVRHAARTLLLEGADIIKLMASGGAVALDRDFPTSPQYTLEEMRAAFNEAHDQGKRTSVHCHNPVGIGRAVEAGVDCIEHAALLDEATAELLAKRGVYVVPTVGAVHATVKYGPQFGRPPEDIERAKQRLEQSVKVIRIALEAGVSLGAGVDALGNLFDEIELLVLAGMTPIEALVAATKTNAQILNAQDRLGTLEAGKYADLLLVDGNPAENISDLRKIYITMKGGVSYRPEELKRAIGPSLYY